MPETTEEFQLSIPAETSFQCGDLWERRMVNLRNIMGLDLIRYDMFMWSIPGTGASKYFPLMVNSWANGVLWAPAQTSFLCPRTSLLIRKTTCISVTSETRTPK